MPHHAGFSPQLSAGLEWSKLQHLRIGEHEFMLERRRTGSQNMATLTHESGPTAFGARCFSTSNVQYTVNGMSVPTQFTNNGSVAAYDLLPGDRIVATARDHSPVPILLVPSDSDWKYLDDGSDQGAVWRAPGFNDSNWPTGYAQFGYGDGDEWTLVRSNRSDNTRITTTYFRKLFCVTNAWNLNNVTLNVVRDDGAIVFLNGAEVFRHNMPAGTASYTTPALVSVNNGEEAIFFSTNINPALLIDGTNVLAAEIHQQSSTSSDVSFNLMLTAERFERPELTARLSSDRFELIWPLFPAGFVLESTAMLQSNATWQLVTNSIMATNGDNVVTFYPSPPVSQFYRLRFP